MAMRLPFYRSGKNTWYVWIDGHQRSLGVKGEENEKAAYAAWHRLLSEVAEGVPDASKTLSERIEKPTEAVTLGVLLQRFLDDAKQRVGFHTHRNYVIFLQPIIDRDGKRSPLTLSPEEASSWASNKEWSSSYRHGFIGTLMTAFRWALTKRIIACNPLIGLRKPPKVSRGRKALISPEEHASLVKHADADFADFLQLLWLSGSRPSEISNLQITDVDFANAVAILGKHKTLHLGKERIIVLSTEALAILQRRLPIAQQQGGFFFLATDGKPMTAKAIGGRVRRTCVRAGIRRCIAYGYRHTFATDALSKGIPETSVSALLGHATTTMLHKHYSHLTAKVNVLKEAVGKIR